MKKIFLLFGFINLLFLYSIGQDLHMPDEILKIMEKSIVTYEIKILEQDILPIDRSEKLNYNFFYRVEKGNKISTFEFVIDSNATGFLHKAETFFAEKKYVSAREMYLKALEVDPKYYTAMTYVGQTYGIEKNYKKAIEWYKKTIQLNFIDYMAHWFLADIYKSQGEIDKAVDEITIAMVLNRNNPRIKKAMEDIYKLKKLKTEDWVFNPQMKIDSTGINKVKIEYKGDWLGYALVKAVWEFEPGYKKSMGVEKGTISTIEEKECFVSLMGSFDKKKIKKNPEFNALQLALDNEMIDEYIFFEIVLPEYPFAAYQLTEEFVNDIKNYVIQVRGLKK